MKCTVCAAPMQHVVTDLPFKLSTSTIAIVKHVPVLECTNCREYLLDDDTMGRVEDILNKIDESTELGVVDFAA